MREGYRYTRDESYYYIHLGEMTGDKKKKKGAHRKSKKHDDTNSGRKT